MTTTLSVRSRLRAVVTSCMAILALVVTSASVDAATITVNSFNQIAPGQCTIATAIASMNAAADQVGCTHSGTYGTSDTITLAAGTYASTLADNPANAYPIINVALIINGNGATLSRTVGGVAPFFRFFEVGGGGLTLNNATLTGGNTSSASGGAILVDLGAFSVSGSTFSNNNAGGSGGAIFDNSNSSFTITNTTFTGNTAAGGSGGAIFDNTSGGMTLTNTTFTGNSAGAGSGGAVFDNSTVGLTINNGTFTGNSTTGGGGGAIFDNSSGGLVFNGGSVTNNSIISVGNNGGGIFDNSSGIQITNVVFTGNTATFRGGAIFDNSTVGTGPVSNNCFVGNTATSGGGGIFRTSPTLNAINNWWGAASGPSGAGPGTGDAVSTNVTFAPFLTSPPGICTAAPVPPTIAKSFGAASIALNGSTSLSVTINNPNASTTLTGIGFTDTLPAGLIVSTPNGLTGSCGGGTITASAGSGSISLTGATLAGSAACTFSVNVTGSTLGTKNNTTGAVTSVEGGTGGTASASVTVIAVGPPPPPPTNIPTLQQWALLALALLILIVTAGVTLRPRKKD